MEMNVLECDTIQHGYHVIVRRKFESNCFRLVRAGHDKHFYIGKHKIDSNLLIGHKFGSTFELKKEDGTLKFVDMSLYNLHTNVIGNGEEDKDNRNITDNNKSQKLTKDEIEEMKRQTTGAELIQCLVDNSTTFDEKSTFSQQKYLTKKKHKHLNLFTLIKPNTKFLMEMYFTQSPAKNCHLRIDSLSYILNVSNIMSGGSFMVVDTNLGIVSAALMERINGSGCIVQVHTEESLVGSARQAVQALNIPAETISQCMSSIHMNDVADILTETDAECAPPPIIANGAELSTKKDKRLHEIKMVKQMLRKRDMDALLVITKNVDPYSLVSVLIEFLAPSRPFVIFCQSMDPLKECHAKLKKQTCFLRLSESWMRRYQVLSERTHPEITMHASSGYILTGIKIQQ